MKFVRLLLKIVLPLVVVGSCGLLALEIVNSREAPQRRPRPIAITQVDLVTALRREYRVVAHSQGTVQPRTESTLIPEVSGQIKKMSPNLRPGEFFEAGDVLLEIDSRGYEAAVTIARSELTQARARLSEELARANQAEREWKRLGQRGKADDLVLRKPQVASARAAVNGAKARLAQRDLDLERTRIAAPYAGRVLEKKVDVGQFVSTGSVLARIYAVDYVEIRLPLSNTQLQYVPVPEVYRSDSTSPGPTGPKVLLHTRIGTNRHEWQGRIVRAEGAIDTRTRQLYVIAQVDDPYAGSRDGRPPLKIGQFIEADIEGQTFADVFVIPRGALRTGGVVLLVDETDKLRSREVDVIWTDSDNAVIRSGLANGDRIVTTALAEGLNGTTVRIAGDNRTVTSKDRRKRVKKRSPGGSQTRRGQS